MKKMVVKFYDLKSVIEDELTRIEDRNIKQTKSIHIDYTAPEPGYLAPDPNARGYYTVTITTFNGKTFVV
jgi:hypothetical protein